MFKLFDDDDLQFSMNQLGDLEDGRRNLGEQMPVFIYKLFQYTIKNALRSQLSSGICNEIFSKAGELANMDFGVIGENPFPALKKGADPAKTFLDDQMPVATYRLFQYNLKDVLNNQLGKKTAIELFRNAGEEAGKEFSDRMLNLNLELNKFVEHLRGVLETYKVGILRVEEFNTETGAAILTVSEDLDCSGLPITGETVCNYDEGFLAGVLKKYTGKEYLVIEVDCWATGSRVCRFEASVKE